MNITLESYRCQKCASYMEFSVVYKEQHDKSGQKYKLLQ